MTIAAILIGLLTTMLMKLRALIEKARLVLNFRLVPYLRHSLGLSYYVTYTGNTTQMIDKLMNNKMACFLVIKENCRLFH